MTVYSRFMVIIPITKPKIHTSTNEINSKNDSEKRVNGQENAVSADDVGLGVTDDHALGAIETLSVKPHQYHDERNEILSQSISLGVSKESSFEEILNHVLDQYKIKNSMWLVSRDGASAQVAFVIESGRKEEDILDDLLIRGIGKAANTSVSISPLTVCMGSEIAKDYKSKVNTVESAKQNELQKTDYVPEPTVSKASVKPPSVELAAEDTPHRLSHVQSIEDNNFWNSIKSRIIVQPIIAALKRDAEFTFDFLMFASLAGIIAAIGLIENSSVIVVASMLISPMMGPIVAGTFAYAIKDPTLRNMSIKTELIGLCLCVLVGFIVGVPVSFIKDQKTAWTDPAVGWPTPEMSGRGTPKNLVAGAAIALASGAAVSFSILAHNAGSLVGVAISASLLPPAVNAGILMAFSFKSFVKPPLLKVAFDAALNVTEFAAGACPELEYNSYKPVITCNVALEGLLLSFISFGLTLLNIFCIVIGSLIVLKLKQVSPRASVNSQKDFWMNHVKATKYFNVTAKKPNERLGRLLVDETKNRLNLTDDEAVVRVLETAEAAEYENTAAGIPTFRNYSTLLVSMFSEDIVKKLHQEKTGKRLSATLHPSVERIPE